MGGRAAAPPARAGRVHPPGGIPPAPLCGACGCSVVTWSKGTSLGSPPAPPCGACGCSVGRRATASCQAGAARAPPSPPRSAEGAYHSVLGGGRCPTPSDHIYIYIYMFCDQECI